MKYRYDIKYGHYVLNEGEAAQQTNNVSTQIADSSSATDVSTSTEPKINNLNSEEVASLQQEKTNKLKQVNDQITRLNDNINQINQKLSVIDVANTNQQAINTLQTQLLQAQKELADKKFEIAKIENDMDNKIIQAQLKLVESFSRKFILPEKYRYLNESNIQNAKIYVDKLIKNDTQERIKGMVDFKKTFSDSELLYGKDKEGGYFAVCVDQADFNKLTDTLEEAGWLRDEILACCLPQIFDRSNLTK